MSTRYDKMIYNRCGKSGLLLPAISLGLWHNFGSVDRFDNMVDMVTTAFDLGITHFDLANNYGPRPGSAEENFGKILKTELHGYRDELIISSKAGYRMWQGPYGDMGSKKYLVASLDQSLKRLGLDYVDIFYSHRFDPETPLEETMDCLAGIIRSGKALYVGLSNYQAEQTAQASALLRSMGVKCLIHQPSYSMLNRWIEDGLQTVLEQNGMGSIAFCPLQQGILTNRYLDGIPADSRAAKETGALCVDQVNSQVMLRVKKLNDIAAKRGQSIAQMALAWVLRGGHITSALIGASRAEQIRENVAALDNLDFTESQLSEINDVLKE